MKTFQPREAQASVEGRCRAGGGRVEWGGDKTQLSLAPHLSCSSDLQQAHGATEIRQELTDGHKPSPEQLAGEADISGWQRWVWGEGASVSSKANRRRPGVRRRVLMPSILIPSTEL